MRRLLDLTLSGPDVSPENLYSTVLFPAPHAHRPYCYINMASTVDGKTVVGKPDGTAVGVGSETDQILFRRLQVHCDAALIGATTLRASNVIYPPHVARIVVTTSGNVPINNRFFTDAPDRAYIACPANAAARVQALSTSGPRLLVAGDTAVDFVALMRQIRTDLDVRLLLCEGGGTINEQLMTRSLVDELFLTLAPKLKGGATLHTMMDGTGFAPGMFARCRLLSVYEHENELYLRYQISSSG